MGTKTCVALGNRILSILFISDRKEDVQHGNRRSSQNVQTSELQVEG